jgi:hypothetical protein
LGDSAQGWFPIFYEAKMNPFPPSTKIILPTAPMIKVTLNQGFPMNAWYDIFEMPTLQNIDKAIELITVDDLNKNASTINNIIE